MKKIVALGILTLSLAAGSAFGQGYFTFTTGKSQAWDGFTTAGASALSTKTAVGLLWAAASTSTPMPISTTPTSGNSNTSEPYTAAQAWAALTGSAGWTVAANAADSSIVRTLTSATGGITYNGGVSFGISGTAPSTTYTLIIFSYDGQYASPAAAAAAGSAIGWSTPFQYAAVTSIGTGASMAGSAGQFGTFIPASVPEPGTMALAALGGASLLLFRRKK